MLLRPRPGSSRADGDDLLARLRGLPATVPEILELQCGWNFSPERADGYELALRVRVRGRAELAAYRAHSAHQLVLTRIQEMCSAILAVDFEI